MQQPIVDPACDDAGLADDAGERTAAPALVAEAEPPTAWVRAPVPEAAHVLAAAGYPRALALLMARRGVEDAEAAERFLHPAVEHLHSHQDGARFAGMERAVDLLVAARDGGRAVAVVGDYDVDGISSTALLLAALRACGLTADAILPHRITDGYGLQVSHVAEATRRGAAVLLTVDCGSTAHAAVEEAIAAGLAVIVVDHHLPDRPLPPEVAHVNPRQEGCPYPFRDLAAAGLALKVALALGDRLGHPLPVERLLRVACLGTVADMVPLRGENRVIAALGLKSLGATRSRGLRALFRQAQVATPLSATDVGFRIGPRLNAAGRLGSAEPALELLLTRDDDRAVALAEQLERLNGDRQRQEQQVVEEAGALVAARATLPPVIVEWSPDWHRGVVGIAASRLVRAHCRPSLLLAVDGDLATGSGRSVPGVALYDFLAPWASELERFGGHAQAIGLTVRTDRLDSLRAAWEEAASRWPPDALGRTRVYELELAPRHVNRQLLRQLEQLEPHGEGNPRPLARVGPLRLLGSPRTFGRGHLRALASGPDGHRVPLLGWNWEARSASLRGDFEVLATLERDRLTGEPVLHLVDARPAVVTASAA
ncbi:MAG TPA: single-stranded-DNA-specific exonuclease RecJ [Thermoanaerobaculia bacterium]|nr:single-stranded-DNA-specific exonuclease RecJ [Thermoanaerobaculia bacterium]